MAKKNQSDYVERQKTKGFIYFQKWLPKKLWEDVKKLVKEYEG